MPAIAGTLVHGVDTDACLDRVLEVCARRSGRLAAVVLTGDQTKDTDELPHRRLRARVERSTRCVLAAPGNHDLPDAHAAVWGEEACLELPGWRLVSVDTTIPGELHGRVDVGRLCARLDALDDRWTLLVMHHPPLSPARHRFFRLDRADQLLQALKDRVHIRALLTGHVHTPFEAVVHGLGLLGGPSTGIPFDHSGEEFVVGAGGPVGARVVQLHDDGTVLSQLVVP